MTSVDLVQNIAIAANTVAVFCLIKAVAALIKPRK